MADSSQGKRKPTKTVIVIVVVLVCAVAIAFGINIFLRSVLEPDAATSSGGGQSSGPSGVSSDDAEEGTVMAYFQENGELVSVVTVEDSTDVQTEEQATSTMSNRGFGESVLMSDYSEDGSYHQKEAVSDTSSRKHPTYELDYKAASGDLWTVLVYNGQVMANPVSYNLQSTRPAQLIISESETVTSYDSSTNSFYVTKPAESALIVKKVDRIDAATLDALTIEEIDAL